MIRPEHPFDIRPDLRKAASTKAASVIRPNQLVRIETFAYVGDTRFRVNRKILKSTVWRILNLKKNVQKLYLKTIHSNTDNTSSIELFDRLSNKHRIVTENMHDSS